ncbi:MAG: M23 family metallopeptidase [Fimbriimonadaceae bacterium]|nr:M23 family metallopeptidase [Chitinophagales bacterium]
MAKSKTRKWISRLRNKYRLVLMHDKTFEVQASVKLSALNVLIIASTLFVILSFIVYSLIAFTPLKNYVVGTSEVTTSRQVMRNNTVTDSILRSLSYYDLYLGNLQKRLNGEIDSMLPLDSLKKIDYRSVKIDSASELDKNFRTAVEREDLFNLTGVGAQNTGEKNIKSLHFFPPLKGTITSEFNPGEGHYGVDVVANESTPVKACLDGAVIDAYWNVESGNVIVIQHDHGLISLYKHNSVLLKKTGNFVNAGDVIAIIGNTGELSTGPHVHFELWQNKLPMDPLDFIIFN